jgi:hypothetical protein
LIVHLVVALGLLLLVGLGGLVHIVRRRHDERSLLLREDLGRSPRDIRESERGPRSENCKDEYPD